MGVASGRFAMALHALALLAEHPEEGCTSAFIAGSVNTHAVVLRRVLGTLVRGGLVEPREGRGGGYRLTRPPERITLAEVYRVVDDDGPLAPSPAEPNPACPVGGGMRAAFASVAANARDGLVAALGRQTVRDVARAALLHARR